MSHDQLREKVWSAYFLSDYAVRYWLLYEFWLSIFAGVVKAFLALAGVLAIVGLMLDPKYQFISALVGAGSGLLATVIIPAFGWDNIVLRVVNVRNVWTDVRNGYRAVWEDVDDVAQPQLEKRFETWLARDAEMEQVSLGLPVIKRFQDKAYNESERLCAE